MSDSFVIGIFVVTRLFSAAALVRSVMIIPAQYKRGVEQERAKHLERFP